MVEQTAPGFDAEQITAFLSAAEAHVLEPIVRKAAESFYDQVLGTIHDYLIDNLDFNLKSHLSMLENENRSMRAELNEIDKAIGYWSGGVNGRAESIVSLQKRALATLSNTLPATPAVSVNASPASPSAMEARIGTTQRAIGDSAERDRT